ncbi:MAG: GreA/GreB family elongation factor [Phyllobacterium sp.]
MSRAFTHEQDDAPLDLAERPVSPHRNLVTPEGFAAIEAEITTLRHELVREDVDEDKERIARLSRDLRYWQARRESAEILNPDPKSEVVRFGMSVTVESEDGETRTWKIVGEDEADVGHGTISHVSPMAKALFGKGVGEEIDINDKSWEIVGLGAK